ncbi:MAG TPA: hypothetical protein VHH35_14455 [Pyrinomonadaceae bacterium]|nr:hypothetical protein [Pyrinomonadaceae bacterium]
MSSGLSEYESLLLTFLPEVKLFLSEQELPDFSVRIGDAVTSRPSYPPWPACADVLFNSQSDVFVGLSYSIGESYRPLVRALCNELPNDVVRYNDMSSPSLAKPYAEDDLEGHRLEIIWGGSYPDRFHVAQLDSAFWYYSDVSAGKQQVVALGLTYVNQILREYNLRLPRHFRFPFFTPDFV